MVLIFLTIPTASPNMPKPPPLPPLSSGISSPTPAECDWDRNIPPALAHFTQSRTKFSSILVLPTAVTKLRRPQGHHVLENTF